MKILYLFSNFRWTGPAEPCLNLYSKLKDMGLDITFASASFTKGGLKNEIKEEAQTRGLKINTDFNLCKHLNLPLNIKDLKGLSQFIKKEKFDIIHTNLTNDHLIGGWVARTVSKKIRIIRTSYDGVSLRRTPRNILLIKKFTDGLITSSNLARLENHRKFRFPLNKIWFVDVAIDLARFNPDRALPDKRGDFGIKADDFVVGIVARIQPHRRYNVFLKAISLAQKKMGNLKAMIIGRGDYFDKLITKPIRQMKLENTILLAGYRSDDDYVGCLKALDVKVFLVPGTDGSCRAVREAMAMGKPVICAKRGMLPEIVKDGTNGLVVKDTPDNLARSIVKLANDKKKLKSFGEHSRNYAKANFSLEHQAQLVHSIYKNV